MIRNLFPTIVFLLSPFSQGAEPLPIDQLWKSESFRKAYTGSYGIDSQIEPLINEDESFYLSEAAKLMADGDRPGAIKKLQASDIVSKSPALLFSMGNFHFEEGKLKEAISYFKDALTLFPNFRDAHRNLAMLQIQEGDYNEAEKHLKRAIELGSQEGLTYGLLAFCHTRKDRLQAALSAYRMALVTMPDEIQWKLGEAFTLQSLGEADKATSIYAELIEKNPENGSLWINQANAYALKGDYELAISHLEFASRMGQLTPTNRLVLGQLYLDQEFPEMAMQNIGLALSEKKIPLDQATGALQGLTSRGYWKEAKKIGTQIGKTFQEELAKTKSSTFERSMALVELETGNAAAGARRVEQLLKKDPVDGEALILLAKFREESGKPEDAMVLLEQAAIQPEKEAEALKAHGQILVNQFRYKEALPKLKRSQQLSSSDQLEDYIEEVEDLVDK